MTVFSRVTTGLLLAVIFTAMWTSMAQAQDKKQYTVDACRYDQGEYRVGVLCIPRSLYVTVDTNPGMQFADLETVMPTGVKAYLRVRPYSIEDYPSRDAAVERYSRMNANVLTAEELEKFRSMPVVKGFQGPFKGIRQVDYYRIEYRGIEVFMNFLDMNGKLVNPGFSIMYKGLSMRGGLLRVDSLEEAGDSLRQFMDLMLNLEK